MDDQIFLTSFRQKGTPWPHESNSEYQLIFPSSQSCVFTWDWSGKWECRGETTLEASPGVSSHTLYQMVLPSLKLILGFYLSKAEVKDSKSRYHIVIICAMETKRWPICADVLSGCHKCMVVLVIIFEVRYKSLRDIRTHLTIVSTTEYELFQSEQRYKRSICCCGI